MRTMKMLIYGSMLLSTLVISTITNAALVGNPITITTSGSITSTPFPGDEPLMLMPANPGSFLVSPQGETDFSLNGIVGEPFPGVFEVIEFATFDVFNTGINLNTTQPGEFYVDLVFEGLDWGGIGSLQDVQITNSSGFVNNSFPTIDFTGPGATGFTLQFNGASPANQFFTPASLSIQLTPLHAVPTPSALLLFGTGLAGLVGWRWWSTTKNV